MLRRLPAVALEALLATYNSLWETGTFPETWREATVIPILKAGKSGLDPLHYRPISLTSSLSKLMEKMVNMRLSWFLEHHNVFTNAQCGFRKHRSPVDHILTLDTEARACFAEKKHLGAVFFDIEAAYDTVLRQCILAKLHRYGIRGRMGLFIENFLSDRSFRVRVGNHLSSSFTQENGVPQGGVLSVALFAVAINDIGDQLPTSVGR
ncbi:MAG: reverse transcriptase family protein, partial [Amphritea sp.]|nr:reverse transcriptase family protein [Amphritea sp.]